MEVSMLWIGHGGEQSDQVVTLQNAPSTPAVSPVPDSYQTMPVPEAYESGYNSQKAGNSPGLFHPNPARSVPQIVPQKARNRIKETSVGDEESLCLDDENFTSDEGETENADDGSEQMNSSDTEDCSSCSNFEGGIDIGSCMANAHVFQTHPNIAFSQLLSQDSGVFGVNRSFSSSSEDKNWPNVYKKFRKNSELM